MHPSRRWLVAVRPPLEVLGLNPREAHTPEAIRGAFRDRAKRLHPDAGGNAEQFKELNNAYEALRRDRGAGGGGRAGAYPEYGEGVGGAPSSNPHADEGAGRRREGMYYERYNVGGERRTWDYGDGRTYANHSTSNFYRPYSRNYADPQRTGFTHDELRAARFATYLYVARRVVFNIVFYGLFLWLLLGLWRGLSRSPETARPRSARVADDPSRPGTNDDEESVRARRPVRMTPHLQEHWSDAEKAEYLRRWNATVRARELQTTAGGVAGRAAPPLSTPRYHSSSTLHESTAARRATASYCGPAPPPSVSRTLPADAGVEVDEL